MHSSTPSLFIERRVYEGEGAKLFAVYAARGERVTNRILDIIDKDPKRSLNSAIDRQADEDFAKKMLITFGAVAVGSGLAAMG